jgi:hypothetical protein
MRCIKKYGLIQQEKLIMETYYNEFIKRTDERKNSAQAKLKMLVYGVRDNPELFMKYSSEFKEEHYAYDNGNWGVDKNRLTPTELALPGGIVSKLHIRPDSPLSLGAIVVCTRPIEN